MMTFVAALAFMAGEAAAPTAPFEQTVAEMLAAPQSQDYSSLWGDFAARGEADAHEHYALLGEFADPFAPTDAECDAQRAAVRTALNHVPVSLMLHYLSGACGDDDEAVAHAEVIRGLIAAQAKPFVGQFPGLPYRVFNRWDAVALVRSKGLTIHST